MILVSKSAIGGKLLRKLGKPGFSVWAMYHSLGREGDPLLKEEWSSNIKMEQLLPAEEKYQKAVQNLIETQAPLKEMSGMMKKPSVMIWEEEKEMSEEYEVPCEPKITLLTPSKEEPRSL